TVLPLARSRTPPDGVPSRSQAIRFPSGDQLEVNQTPPAGGLRTPTCFWAAMSHNCVPTARRAPSGDQDMFVLGAGWRPRSDPTLCPVRTFQMWTARAEGPTSSTASRASSGDQAQLLAP